MLTLRFLLTPKTEIVESLQKSIKFNGAETEELKVGWGRVC